MDKDTKEGVQDAFYAWLQEHPVSIGDIITDAVKVAVKEWMDDHPDALRPPVVYGECK